MSNQARLAILSVAATMVLGCGGNQPPPQQPTNKTPPTTTPTTATPAASIGLATMDDAGVIQMMLRAEGPNGMIGDAMLVIRPGDPTYESTIAHLGGLSPGESKPVPPYPDAEPSHGDPLDPWVTDFAAIADRACACAERACFDAVVSQQEAFDAVHAMDPFSPDQTHAIDTARARIDTCGAALKR